MKEITKTVYVIIGKNKEIEKETLEKAEETKEFLEEVYEIPVLIEQRQKTEYEIEKGDKVHWIKNNSIDTNRIDIITNIVKNAWGDIVYNTKELNGNKIGQAYKNDLSLIV